MVIITYLYSKISNAMKKFISFIQAALLFASGTVFAQKEINVMAVNKEMSRGLQPGYMVNIPEAKIKDIRSAYEKRLEENTKVNAKEVEAELVNYGAVNKNFSEHPFIIYARLVETIEGVELTAFVTEDSLNFLNESSSPDKVAALKKSLHDFSVEEYKKVASKQLEAENDKLNELKKTLDSQISDENSNTKSIGSKQREIENYKSKIETNKTQQAAKTDQIASQKKLADGIADKNTPEYSLAAKNLKKYEGEK